jgi:hypothetical protein
MRIYLVMGVLMSLAACGERSDRAPMDAQKAEAPKPITDAQQVLEGLRTASLPIDKVRTITAESDSNQLLGRPHQYTSKIDFIDTRFPEGKLEEAINNIEVFSKDEDAAKRRDYIDGIMKDMPLATQYLYLRKNVLLRINGAVSPAAATEYEKAVEKIVG